MRLTLLWTVVFAGVIGYSASQLAGAITREPRTLAVESLAPDVFWEPARSQKFVTEGCGTITGTVPARFQWYAFSGYGWIEIAGQRCRVARVIPYPEGRRPTV
jgi:hypothetical protein